MAVTFMSLFPNRLPLSRGGPLRATGPEAAEHGPDRPRDDQQVEPEGEVLDVIEIILELPEHVADIGDMALLHLGPAGDARADDVPVTVERQLALIPLRERDGFGARADPAHLALEDVDDLRKLVD